MERSLVAGAVYFLMLSNDRDGKVPIIQTLVFIRRALTDDGQDILLFKYIPIEGEDKEWFVPQAALELILDRETLAARLLERSVPSGQTT